MKSNTFNFYPLAFLLLIIATSFSFSAFHASSAAAPKAIHREVHPPTTPISLKEFTTLSRKEFESRTGQKLSLWQRIQFKMMQRKIRKELKENPDEVDKLASVSLKSGMVSISSFFLALSISSSGGALLILGLILMILAIAFGIRAILSGKKVLKQLEAMPVENPVATKKAKTGIRLGCIPFIVILIIFIYSIIVLLTVDFD